MTLTASKKSTVFRPVPHVVLFLDVDGTVAVIDKPWMESLSEQLQQLPGGENITLEYLEDLHYKHGGGEQGLVDTLGTIQKVHGLKGLNPGVFLNAGRNFGTKFFPGVHDRLLSWSHRVQAIDKHPHIDVSTCGLHHVCLGAFEKLAKAGISYTVSGQILLTPDDEPLRLSDHGLRTALTKVGRVRDALDVGVSGKSIAFICDGLTDIPAARVILENGGLVVPVFTPGDQKAMESAKVNWGPLLREAREEKFDGYIASPIAADWSQGGLIDQRMGSWLNWTLRWQEHESPHDIVPGDRPKLELAQQGPGCQLELV